MAQQLMNPARIHEDARSIPGLAHRHGLDPSLLWLWCRPAVVTPIRPQAWEPPCATGMALKKKKKKKMQTQTKTKRWYNHTGEYYSAVKRNEVLI